MESDIDPDLVPELLVTDLESSLRFWRDTCGFEVKYSRLEDGFAYVTHGSAHVMLEQAGVGRNWITGVLDRPLGRGINFQISVDDASTLSRRIQDTGTSLFMDLEEKWYRVGQEEAGVSQFLVTDPDGYLIRFQSSLSRRSLHP